MGLYTDRGYTLEEAKGALLLEIESWYGSATLDTFDTAAGLGSLYRYECNEAAQLRMIHGKTSNQPITLRAGPVLAADQDPAWDWVAHTATEAGKIHTAYVQFSAGAAVTYQAYKDQVPSLTSVAAADSLLNTIWGIG